MMPLPAASLRFTLGSMVVRMASVAVLLGACGSSETGTRATADVAGGAAGAFPGGAGGASASRAADSAAGGGGAGGRGGASGSAGSGSGGHGQLGACHPIEARRYDIERSCFAPVRELAGVCLRESAPDTTTGTAEVSCLVDPDGTRWLVRQGYTVCLEAGDGTVMDGFGGGWETWALNGLCGRDPWLLWLDGGDAGDAACRDAFDAVTLGFDDLDWTIADIGPACTS
jgi:hypothetical protein